MKSEELLKKYKVYKVNPMEVYIREDRQRKTFNKKKLDELIASIKELGQLQPGICTHNEEGRVELVAGERRLRACGALEIPFFYILREDLDDFTYESIQLEENIKREDLDWKEVIEAKDKLHRLFQQRFGEAYPGSASGHSVADTAEYIGESKSITHEDLELAEWVKEIPEVAAAPNKTTAKKIVKRLKETIKRDVALERAIEQSDHGTLFEVTSKEEPTATAADDGLSSFEKRLLEYDRRVIHGEFEEVAKGLQKECFDLVLFDPPWGVDLHTNYKDTGTTKSYEDSKEVFDEKLEGWLQTLFQLMKPDSTLFMFFAIRFHQQIYDTLEAVGFRTHRIPIIWYKRGSHTVRNPKLWPGLSYEPIAIAKKGNKDLVIQGRGDVIITPPPTPSIKSIHPSAKHPMIYKELLELAAMPGDLVLDPMAGSGMAGVAADALITTHHLDWYLIELDEDYRNLAITNLLKGYWAIDDKERPLASPDQPISFVDTYEPKELPDDFKELEPGSADWTRYWRLHPEKQEAMLAWKKEREANQ